MCDRKRRQLLATGAAAMLSPLPHAAAQAGFPARTVRIVTPFGPGSGLDSIARGLAPSLGKQWSVPVVIENREGAAGAVGAQTIASAAPDGYALLLAASPPFAVTPILRKEATYHPIEGYTPIARIAEIPMVLVATRGGPVATFEELVAYARRHPGKLDYASAGIGVPSHLFMEQMKRALGLDLTYVPYRSTGQMYADVLSGQVPLATVSLGVAKPHLDTGAWRALAIGVARRHPTFPAIPTIREVVPEHDLSAAMKVWYGLLGPHAVSSEIVDAIARGVERGMQSAEFATVLAAQFAEPAFEGPAAFATSLRSHYDANLGLIRSLGLAGTT